MNAADWIVLLIVAAAVLAALRSLKKNKGSCGTDPGT